MPSFIVFGAPRSGTTALHHYLGQHPQVFMCPVKEPNYFACHLLDEMPEGAPHAAGVTRNFITRRSDYEALFDAVRDERVVGEVSPRYLTVQGSAQRISEALPAVRLIAILRQPVDRLYAAFCGLKRDGLEPCDTFVEALEAGSRREVAGEPLGRYPLRTGYFAALSTFFDLFPHDHVRVYLYEDFRRDPGAILADCFRFLGVADQFRVDTSTVHNPTGRVRSPWLRFLWERSHDLRTKIRPLLPVGLRDAMFEWVVRNPIREPLDPRIRAVLTEQCREDIGRLETLLGRDLGEWLEPTPSSAPTP